MIDVKRILVLLLIMSSAVVPLVSWAAVSQLVFTTEPRTVATGVISDVITIQTQDGSGAEAKMEETGDVSFVSSSVTGQFVNINGEPVSVVMNRNSANRNFYYRDSTAGTPILTITVTARTSGSTWSVPQTITVGGNASVTNNSNTEATTTSTQITTTNGPWSGTLSAHASPALIGQVPSPEPFKVGAGRSRLASIHSPVFFRAELSSPIISTVRYQWSFGDGGSAIGEQANHIYYFPGEYNVVLNAVGPDRVTAVSRTTVSVIQPLVIIKVSSAEQVEIINHSTQELNIGGWRISQRATAFTFPDDTIIAAGKSSVIPVAYLGFSLVSNLPLTLTFPDAAVAFTVAPTPDKEALQIRLQELRQLSAKLASIEVSRRRVSASPLVQNTQAIGPALSPKPTTSLPLSAAVMTIPVPKSPGLFARIKHWFTK